MELLLGSEVKQRVCVQPSERTRVEGHRLSMWLHPLAHSLGELLARNLSATATAPAAQIICSVAIN
jgi:hypothetical protein